ncbi:MAG: DUF4340 domain-containing protein [Verrucomicrobia bacterium]|nr:DUF4340 domain-containing protein [Verrucomicrobiota bacterium]
MNRKQFTLLIALVIVVGGLGLMMNAKKQATWQRGSTGAGGKLLAGFDYNAVASLTIKSASNEVTLAKREEGWRVKERGEYPANFSTLADFLRKAADLKIVQSEPIGASQFERMELNQPGKGAGAGTLVEFRDKDGKPLRTLVLGKKQMKKSEGGSPFGGGEWPVGRWVMDLKDTANVSLVSDALSDIEPNASHWLDKEFFKVEKVRSVAVAHTNPTNSWKLTRDADAGEWKLADAKAGEQPLDPAKANAIGNPFSFPSFADVVAADAKPADTGLDQPTVVTIETADKLTYTMKVGAKSGEDNLHLAMTVKADLAAKREPAKDEKPEDKDRLDKEFAESQKKLQEKLAAEKKFERYAFLVSKWTVDAVLKNRAELLAEKKEEPKPEVKSDEPLPGTAAPKAESPKATPK